MEWITTAFLRLIQFVLATALATTLLTGCGDDVTQISQNTPTTTSASSLAISINSVAINSAPVVTFSVANEDGVAFTGLTTDDLRFTIAKLTPDAWQNYINREETAEVGPGTGNTTIQATRENDGVLVDNADGTYSYTFATDITNVTEPLAVSYEPSQTHRVAMQTRGSLPAVNAVYTFRPSDGSIVNIPSREIVSTAKCNECHNKLELHDARIEVQYCVTCHNPGSTDANSGNTVDFKVMIHKIHRGADLTVVQGADGETFDDYDTPGDETADNGEYAIWGFNDSKHDYSTVVLPQDIRNCVKCHDGSDPDTPQGDNWQTQLSMEACGACHDDVDFSKDGSDAGANDPDGHEGGIVSDNSFCITCHSDGGDAGSVQESHYMPEPVLRQKFKLNILEICGTPVGTDPGPICAPGVNPSVKYSITDPTNGDAEYNLNTTPEITDSSVSFLVAWDTNDYNNTDGTGDRPGRADSIDFDEAGFVDSGNTRTVTAGFVIPNGGGATGYIASGSGAIGAQGRLAGDFNDDGMRERSERIFVKSEVAFFRIDDATVQERRPTVSNDKCNKCHDQVSFHGGSRSGEYGVCVLCHNPNNTDIAQRTGGPVPPDGKLEESIDLRRMVHGIHAGEASEHGFRENGLVVFGYNNSVHDYSHVRFPGILQDCETCHEEEAYWLTDRWAAPTANNLLSSTIETDPVAGDALWEDPDDDLNISPTAAVCSSCHDSDVAKAHMQVPGGAAFGETQTDITSMFVETCSVCHGPGKSADVEAVHAER